MSLNSCHFSGRLTRDPETRTFASGKKVVRFGLAVDNGKKNKDSGEWESEPAFLEMEAWEGTAALLERYKKGDYLIIADCSVRQENWESNGQKRSRLVFRVNRVELPPQARKEAPPARAEVASAVEEDAFSAPEDDIPF